MVKAKKYIIGKHFQGEPKRTDLPLVEEELPPLKNGGEFYTVLSIVNVAE